MDAEVVFSTAHSLSGWVFSWGVQDGGADMVGNTAGLVPAQPSGTLSIPANKTFAIRFGAVKK
jgi:hypothetical protein